MPSKFTWAVLPSSLNSPVAVSFSLSMVVWILSSFSSLRTRSSCNASWVIIPVSSSLSADCTAEPSRLSRADMSQRTFSPSRVSFSTLIWPITALWASIFTLSSWPAKSIAPGTVSTLTLTDSAWVASLMRVAMVCCTSPGIISWENAASSSNIAITTVNVLRKTGTSRQLTAGDLPWHAGRLQWTCQYRHP